MNIETVIIIIFGGQLLGLIIGSILWELKEMKNNKNSRLKVYTK